MAYTAENWPITAALLQFPGIDAAGTEINDAEAPAWAASVLHGGQGRGLHERRPHRQLGPSR